MQFVNGYNMAKHIIRYHHHWRPPNLAGKTTSSMLRIGQAYIKEFLDPICNFAIAT
jgi:hypothetical protein